MTESGMAELRRLLHTRSTLHERTLRKRFFGESERGMYQDACNWLAANSGFWGEQIGDLTPSELRQFLEFVLYAETDK
jgi:hypothetical protein